MNLAVQPVFSPLHGPLTQPLLSQLLYEDVIGESVKGLTKVKVNNIIIVEGCQVGQARFPLHKSMLTTQNHLLVLFMSRKGF